MVTCQVPFGVRDADEICKSGACPTARVTGRQARNANLMLGRIRHLLESAGAAPPVVFAAVAAVVPSGDVIPARLAARVLAGDLLAVFGPGEIAVGAALAGLAIDPFRVGGKIGSLGVHGGGIGVVAVITAGGVAADAGNGLVSFLAGVVQGVRPGIIVPILELVFVVPVAGSVRHQAGAVGGAAPSSGAAGQPRGRCGDGRAS